VEVVFITKPQAMYCCTAVHTTGLVKCFDSKHMLLCPVYHLEKCEL
jgi:hypothetical protein